MIKELSSEADVIDWNSQNKIELKKYFLITEYKNVFSTIFLEQFLRIDNIKVKSIIT